MTDVARKSENKLLCQHAIITAGIVGPARIGEQSWLGAKNIRANGCPNISGQVTRSLDYHRLVGNTGDVETKSAGLNTNAAGSIRKRRRWQNQNAKIIYGRVQTGNERGVDQCAVDGV